jgi:hypothetical protein
MPANQIDVGPQNNADSSRQINARGGRQGDQIVSELHGRYYEQAYRQNMFSGAAVGLTTTVGTATTYTGLVLTNPIGSGVNLVPNKLGLAFLVAFAAASAIGLMRGYSATTAVVQTTPVTPSNTLTGANSGKGLLASSATLPVTPTIVQIMEAGLTGAITTTVNSVSLFDLEGSIAIPPGGFLAIYTSTASGAASMAASMQWEEVPA